MDHAFEERVITIPKRTNLDLLVFASETESGYVTQASPNSQILLPLAPECWDERCVPLYSANICLEGGLQSSILSQETHLAGV